MVGCILALNILNWSKIVSVSFKINNKIPLLNGVMGAINRRWAVHFQVMNSKLGKSASDHK